MENIFVYKEYDDIIKIDIKDNEIEKLKKQLYKKNNFIKKLLNYIDNKEMTEELLNNNIENLENDINELESINIKLIDIIKNN